MELVTNMPSEDDRDFGLKLGSAFALIFKKSNIRTTKGDLLSALGSAGIVPGNQTSKQAVLQSGFNAANRSQAMKVSERLLKFLQAEGLFEHDENGAAEDRLLLSEAFESVGAGVDTSGKITWLQNGQNSPAMQDIPRTVDNQRNQSMPPNSSTHSDMAEGLTKTSIDDRAVFIVHGRNLNAKAELEKFLRHIDLFPISWTEAANATNKTRPSTMDIIEAGMSMARAIVVLFSPDDEARLKSRFHKPGGEKDYEANLTGQARQNVLLEAGMALGKAPDRTVFVRLGNPRPISDIEGINWIDLDDGFDNRSRLFSELRKAGASVRTGLDLRADSAGRFTGIPY